MNPRSRRLVETAAVAIFGGALAGGVGVLVGLTLPAAAVGAASGALAGWRRIYDWRRPTGVVAFALDSTWGLPMTSAALFSNTVGLLSSHSGYVPELSERCNRHVYRRGFVPRKGFAITVGNVVSGAGDVEVPRRARLVTDHEDVHVWQARWFGPAYPVLYVGWMILGAVVGGVMWLVSRRRRGDRLPATMETVAYFLNPFEWWAYSRDAYWPPSGKVLDLGWKQPCCRPLVEARPNRPSGMGQARSVYR